MSIRKKKTPQPSNSAVRFIAAPFTPLDGSGKLRLPNIAPTADFLVSQGVAGVFICGTTGEGMSLTIKERKAVTEAWVKAGRGRLEIITHVGHSCVADARELAAHAERSGVDAVASIGPTFYEAASPQALTAYCGQIAAAAPTRKFYYYHMPSMAPVNFPASAAFALLRDEISSFAGIKFTHEDLKDYRKCQKLAAGKHEIFFGRDELFLSGLKAGARSAVGSTYNFALPLYLKIIKCEEAGEFRQAAKLQKLAREGIDIMVRAGGLPAIKEAMSLISGVENGGVRLPLWPVSRSNIATMREELEKIGYLAALK